MPRSMLGLIQLPEARPLGRRWSRPGHRYWGGWANPVRVRESVCHRGASTLVEKNARAMPKRLVTYMADHSSVGY